jgi:hypothetical protein
MGYVALSRWTFWHRAGFSGAERVHRHA